MCVYVKISKKIPGKSSISYKNTLISHENIPDIQQPKLPR